MSKRWIVKDVESNEEAADMEKSTLLLTINPNVVEGEEDVVHFKAVIKHLTDNLDKVLLLRQGDIAYGYEGLEPLLVGNIGVSVKYEVGSRFHRNHVHIKIEAVMRTRGSKMHIDLAKLRGYLREQIGYSPHVDVKAIKDSVFDVERYIQK